MRYFILGSGDYAQMLESYLDESGVAICAYVVDPEYIEGDVGRKKVISFKNLFNSYDPCETILYMGIGYGGMGDVRARKYTECKKQGFTFANYVHRSSVIHPSVKMGEGNNLFEGVIAQYGCTIGNCNLLYAGATLGHNTHLGSFNTMSINACTAGFACIGDGCFLGVGSVVSDHVRIRNHALIGGSAYASRDLDEYRVLASPRSLVLSDRLSTDIY